MRRIGKTMMKRTKIRGPVAAPSGIVEAHDAAMGGRRKAKAARTEMAGLKKRMEY